MMDMVINLIALATVLAIVTSIVVGVISYKAGYKDGSDAYLSGKRRF